MADVETPPPKVDTHDPLPEGNWMWRRIFVFALCTALLISSWFIIKAMIDLSGHNSTLAVQSLTKIVGWGHLLVWFAMTYYIVGTNAEQVVKIVQTAGMFKQGLVTTVTQTATDATGAKATSQTTTGPAVTPVPPAPPAEPPHEAPWATN